MAKKLSLHHWLHWGLVALFSVVMVSTPHAKTMENVIPGDSFVSVKLQNLQACRDAIETSAKWKEAAEIIAALPNWQPVNQFMQTLPMFFGTDVQGLIETFFGGGLAVTVSPGAEGLMVGIIIENEGTPQQSAEQLFGKFIGTLAGMEGNEVHLDEGTYQDIPYHTAQINEQQLTYGSLDETLFLVGITPGCFEKMVDVYKAQRDSIAHNTAYRSVVNTYGKSDVFAFVNVEEVRPFMKALLPPPISDELKAFRTLVYSWDLLHPGGLQRVYGQFQAARQGTLLPQLQEKARTPTMHGLTGDEGFFLAIAPSTANTIGRIIKEASAANPTTDNDTQPTMFDRAYSSLLPAQTDVLGALAGDFVLSTDAPTLYSVRQHSYTLSYQSIDGVIESVGLEFPERNLGFIFNPVAPEKWRDFFNGFLENLTVDSHRQFDYKGITFTSVSVPGTLYYASVNELFVLAFSEKQCQIIVDNLLMQAPTSTLQKRLDGLPGHPAVLLQLDMGMFLAAMASSGEVAWFGTDAMAFTKKRGVLMASLVVGDEAAWLEITLSPEEKAIDAVALFAPAIFLGITKDMTFVQ